MDEDLPEASETRWIVQFAEPFGESHPQRIVDTETEAEATIERLKQHYPEIEDEPGQYRVSLGAKVYITKTEVAYGTLPENWPREGGATEDDGHQDEEATEN